MILVFAKAPQPGQVKTRLIPLLGAEGAAELHARLVRHTLMTATSANLCPVELWCAPSIEEPFFRDCKHDFKIEIRTQTGADLGERMYRAFESSLRHADRVVLIGTDCPDLTSDALREALTALDAHEAVFTPASDGGYVLIGLRQVDRRLFDEIPWGEPEVMAQTRLCLRELGWRWHETETLSDIDTPEDLAKWKGQSR